MIEKWITLVDEGLNSITTNTVTNDQAFYPCKAGAVAAADADSTHTGVMQAGSGAKTVTFDATTLSSTHTFAVCYTEADGTAGATWKDSGIRLQLSKVRSVSYGQDHPSLPARQWYSHINYDWQDIGIHDSKLMAATNRLPQAPNSVLNYFGILPDSKYLSVVEASLNGKNPCIDGTIAAATIDASHSGSIAANINTSTVIVPQTTLLTAESAGVPLLYAICYAEGDGSVSDITWRDSYLRVTITSLATISHHNVFHRTDGTLPRVGTLQITYSGTLEPNKYISFVNASLNDLFPCENATVRDGLDDVHSGVYTADGQIHTISTMSLSSVATFAVCYSSDVGAGDNWRDSGMRVKMSLVTSMVYGADSSRPVSTTFGPRAWTSVNSLLPTSRMPQAANVILKYTGDLPTDNWIAIVDSTLNSNNPCLDGAVATAASDSGHSGAYQSSNGTTEVITRTRTLILTPPLRITVTTEARVDFRPTIYCSGSGSGSGS